jgi:opine dehydrogenase
MRVALVGAGPIGRATAAYLAHHGHEPGIWSPSGSSLADLPHESADRVSLAYEGALSGRASIVRIGSAAALAEYPVVVIAVPGHAYPAVLPAVVDALTARQLVIVSGALSLAPLWIRERMSARGAEPAVVVGWGTTLGTARRTPTADVKLNTLRARFDMAAVPATAGISALQTCRQLFGDRFALADNVLAVTLANVNPIAHAAETLPNLTRIDRKEEWGLFECLTPSAARLCGALDAERLRVAAVFGAKLRSIEEHYRASYHVEGADIAELAAAIHAKYGGTGPTTLEHRYVLEDVPFGLAVIEALARCGGVEVPNVSGSITLLSSACGRDFRADNPLLSDLAIIESTPERLLARCAGSPGEPAR